MLAVTTLWINPHVSAELRALYDEVEGALVTS
jgi:hypothetical protein